MKKITRKESTRPRILIRAANWVGDAIMTTPVIRGVRKNFPGSSITVLAKPWVIPVYVNNPHVDKVMVYETDGRHKMGMGTLCLAKDILRKKFDIAFLMQNAFEAALLAFLAQIPLRVGYNTDCRTLMLNPGIRLDPAYKKKHLIDYYLGILTGVGLETDGRYMELNISQSDRAFADQLVLQNYAGITGPVIGINPGATGGTAKRWFPDRYAALCKRLSRHYATRIMIFGGPADYPLGEKIAAISGNCCINMAGKTTLAQAFALIRCCDLFVTNDSGLMHAAAALNISQVAVIGSTDPVATAPDSSCSAMVRMPVSCSPCLKDECPIDHPCMRRITVDMVFETCQYIMAQNLLK